MRGIHLQQSGILHKVREKQTADMHNWIFESGISFASVADVGAEDCSASYFFKKQGLQIVHLIDPSLKSREIAHTMDLNINLILTLVLKLTLYLRHI